MILHEYNMMEKSRDKDYTGCLGIYAGKHPLRGYQLRKDRCS